MIGSRLVRTSVFALAILILSATVASTRSEQGQTGPTGDLTVVGEVTVNGASAISGATVFSDSTVTTAKGSSAVVCLGKLGRVELLPSSTVNIKFDGSGVTAMLDSGRVRVSSPVGATASISTRDGEVVASALRLSKFTVDTTCGNTIVSTQEGRVELRAGGTVKQIAAGSQDSAGQATPGKPCPALKSKS